MIKAMVYGGGSIYVANTGWVFRWPMKCRGLTSRLIQGGVVNGSVAKDRGRGG